MATTCPNTTSPPVLPLQLPTIHLPTPLPPGVSSSLRLPFVLPNLTHPRWILNDTSAMWQEQPATQWLWTVSKDLGVFMGVVHIYTPMGMTYSKYPPAGCMMHHTCLTTATGYGHYHGEYSFFMRTNDSTPLALVMWGTNLLEEAHYDHYVVEYTHWAPGSVDRSVFDLPHMCNVCLCFSLFM